MYCGPSKSVLEDSTKIQVQTGFNEDTIVNNYMLCMFDQLKCAHKFNLIVQFSLLYPYTPRGPRDFPRAGILQNPHPREISRVEVGVFSNASRLEAVYGHSFRISREVLILWCDNRWL